jgi:hypothetical protein
MRKIHQLSQEEVQEILENRLAKIPERETLLKFNISSRQYSNLLKQNGIKKKLKVFKYKFDEDYFENIDTEDKAYFLGFIIADGNVDSIFNTIQIIQKEPYILNEFKRYINYEGEVGKSRSRTTYHIKVSSFKMKQDLIKLGVVSNKTRIIKYPTIADNLQNHFIRGVFDGDGCISLRTDKRDNQQRGQVNICSGSLEFITEYYIRLVKYCDLSGKNKIRCPSGSYYVIDWGGLSDIEKIYDFLYKDATVYLRRKKETFDAVVSITKNKKKYRK